MDNLHLTFCGLVPSSLGRLYYVFKDASMKGVAGFALVRGPSDEVGRNDAAISELLATKAEHADTDNIDFFWDRVKRAIGPVGGTFTLYGVPFSSLNLSSVVTLMLELGAVGEVNVSICGERGKQTMILRCGDYVGVLMQCAVEN